MKQVFIMMVGLPGSGKSTAAKEIQPEISATIHSSDAIRKEITGDEGSQKQNETVFNELHKRVIRDLEDGKSVIYDACNISYKTRKAFLERIKKYNCIKECMFVWTPYDKCLENNKNRSRHVPEHAIKRMYENIYFPNYYEGWDQITIRVNADHIENVTPISKLFFEKNGLVHMEHDNPHHEYTIGNHCIQCMFNVGKYKTINNDVKKSLLAAALLHDIGKPKVKSFKNGKGEKTEIAHYYQHQHVSMYEAVPYILQQYKELNDVEILNLIQWHMIPYSWEKDNNKKLEDKYRRLWGNYFFDNLMILHKADKSAH